MAVRKRKARPATNRRRNPVRRRKAAATVRTSNRRSNRRVVRRRRNARRNPQLKQLVIGGAYAALGAIAQGMVSSFIPIKGVGIMGLGIQWGAAYLTALIGEKLLPGGSPYFAAGAAAGAAKATFDYFIGNTIGSFTSGQQAGAGAPVVGAGSQPAGELPAAPGVGGYGFSDVVAAPDYYIGGSGMGDVVDAPGYY